MGVVATKPALGLLSYTLRLTSIGLFESLMLHMILLPFLYNVLENIKTSFHGKSNGDSLKYELGTDKQN